MTRVLSRTCRDLFQEHLNKLPSTVKYRFALPGIERQDSVYSGLQEIRPEAALVAVHDSARPLLDPTDAAACMADAQQVLLPACIADSKEPYPPVLYLLGCSLCSRAALQACNVMFTQEVNLLIMCFEGNFSILCLLVACYTLETCTVCLCMMCLRSRCAHPFCVASLGVYPLRGYIQVGAAVLGVPVKPTIKEVGLNGMVTKTLVRANLWEVQTPQVSLTLLSARTFGQQMHVLCILKRKLKLSQACVCWPQCAVFL